MDPCPTQESKASSGRLRTDLRGSEASPLGEVLCLQQRDYIYFPSWTKKQRRLKFSLVGPTEPHDREALPTAANRASDLCPGLEPKEGRACPLAQPQVLRTVVGSGGGEGCQGGRTLPGGCLFLRAASTFRSWAGEAPERGTEPSYFSWPESLLKILCSPSSLIFPSRPPRTDVAW